MSGSPVKTAWACLLVLLPAGCVERTLTVTSEPPGALVTISSIEKGRTPVTIPFLWYGDYDVIVRMEGYETLKTHQKINPPPYEIPPVDLLSELAPWTYHDQRTAHFVLTPATQPAEKELLDRAEELRARNLELRGR